MNLAAIDKIAKAVLYEGYILYPYRASATKNQRRFNFGVLVPPEYAVREGGTERSDLVAELLVRGAEPEIEVRLRFLQVESTPGWQEAMEREVRVAFCRAAALTESERTERFLFDPIEGRVEISAARLQEGLHRVRVRVANRTAMAGMKPKVRDEVLPRSLTSAHLVLAVRGGEFVSLLDPPEPLRAAADTCANSGVWPVLLGDPGSHDAMLASPILLYDYPQVAEESPGDLFDGAEIDEILTLRILTLTDEEKREMRESGERARQILERTESMPPEQLLKLHGVLRGMNRGGA